MKVENPGFFGDYLLTALEPQKIFFLISHHALFQPQQRKWGRKWLREQLSHFSGAWAVKLREEVRGEVFFFGGGAGHSSGPTRSFVPKFPWNWGKKLGGVHQEIPKENRQISRRFLKWWPNRIYSAALESSNEFKTGGLLRLGGFVLDIFWRVRC